MLHFRDITGQVMPGGEVEFIGKAGRKLPPMPASTMEPMERVALAPEYVNIQDYLDPWEDPFQEGDFDDDLYEDDDS